MSQFNRAAHPVKTPARYRVTFAGSGKTLAFLAPALARLDYDVPLDDVLSPQLVVVAPTRELGVQVGPGGPDASACAC